MTDRDASQAALRGHLTRLKQKVESLQYENAALRQSRDLAEAEVHDLRGLNESLAGWIHVLSTPETVAEYGGYEQVAQQAAENTNRTAKNHQQKLMDRIAKIRRGARREYAEKQRMMDEAGQ